LLEEFDPTFLGLSNSVEEAERTSTVDGGLTPAVGILFALGGSVLLSQMVFAAKLVLVLLLRYE
jgi:hypothetical protein